MLYLLLPLLSLRIDQVVYQQDDLEVPGLSDKEIAAVYNTA